LKPGRSAYALRRLLTLVATPPPEADFTGTGSRFRKGHDPAATLFTAEELSAGFWAGLASYVELGGQRQNFLRRKMSARGQSFTATPKRERGRVAA
jgi:hypothetical protein